MFAVASFSSHSLTFFLFSRYGCLLSYSRHSRSLQTPLFFRFFAVTGRIILLSCSLISSSLVFFSFNGPVSLSLVSLLSLPFSLFLSPRHFSTLKFLWRVQFPTWLIGIKADGPTSSGLCLKHRAGKKRGRKWDP